VLFFFFCDSSFICYTSLSIAIVFNAQGLTEVA